jgi:hypothetical protein
MASESLPSTPDVRYNWRCRCLIMATSTQVATEVAVLPERQAVSSAVPWYLWCVVAAVISVMIGGYWDISWHMSIGRDTFWTPAHMAIYFCGVLAGVSCGYLILSNTLAAAAPEREASVQIWGFRAPLGAFICAWGGLAMLASAPFDNWWHAAYGLDVKIFSPPHTVLDTGILAIQIGGMVLIMGARNRAAGVLRDKLDRIFLFLGAMMVSLAMTVVWEYTYRVFLHSSRSYIAVSIVTPILLVGAVRASGRRWAATVMAAIFSLYAMVLLWVFPLFPVTTRLGPVYQHITHFVPMEFPLLLIAPAVALDLLGLAFPAWDRWNLWLQAAVVGAIFLATFVAVEWPFASFLLSSASHNWFFGTHYFPYFEPPTSSAVLGRFAHTDKTVGAFWLGMAEAQVFAILSARLGLACGNWLRRLRR